MEDVYIIGVGMTHFGRHLDKSVKQLVGWSLNDALADSGIDKAKIDAAFFGNSVQGYMEGQTCVRGQIALLPEGLEGIPVVNVENACATASTAFNLAVTHLRAGEGDVALALGAEKMYDEDKVKAILGIPEDMRVITLVIVGKKSDAISPLLDEGQVEREKKRPERLPQHKFIALNHFSEELIKEARK